MTPERQPPWRRQRSLEELDEDMHDLVRDVRGLRSSLDSAPFVRVELHQEQVDGIRRDIGAVRGEIASVRALTMWTLGIMCTFIFGVVVVGVGMLLRGGTP